MVLVIRAFIRDDFAGMFLDIALIHQHDGSPRRILRFGESSDITVCRWEELPDVPQGADLAPTLRLDDTMARALYEALAAHYSGADDVRALRRDYDAERVRVDQLTASLIGVTQALADRGDPEPVLTEDQWRKVVGER